MTNLRFYPVCLTSPDVFFAMRAYAQEQTSDRICVSLHRFPPFDFDGKPVESDSNDTSYMAKVHELAQIGGDWTTTLHYFLSTCASKPHGKCSLYI